VEERRVPVVERGLLDALHGEDLRVEVIVLLRVADVEVMWWCRSMCGFDFTFAISS